MAGKSILTRASRRRGGLTLIEVVMALAVLVMTLVGLISGISYASRTNAVIFENEAAMRGAQKMIETMRSYPMKFVWVCFNCTPNDAANLPAGYSYSSTAYPEWTCSARPGVNGTNRFEVEGLAPIGDTVGGMTWDTVGIIMFPGNNEPGPSPYTLNPATLVEITNTADPLYDPQGTDLNANATVGETITNIYSAANSPYNVLPVTLALRWKSITGKRTMTFRYILTGPSTGLNGDFKFQGQP